MKSTLFNPRLLAAVTAIIFISSCKKNNDDIIYNRTELLTRAPWIQVASEISSNGNGFYTDPQWASAPACEKDDVLIFRANQTYEVNEGTTRCDPSDPFIFISGNWYLSNDQATLTVGSETVTINQLDQSTFQVSYQYNNGGQQVVQRDTYRH
jgi:hypothetical protein